MRSRRLLALLSLGLVLVAACVEQKVTGGEARTSPHPEVILRDDLSTGEGWEVGARPEGTVLVASGSLQFRLHEAGLFWSGRDLPGTPRDAISVTGQVFERTGGQSMLGVECAASKDAFYTFTVDPGNGWYAIERHLAGETNTTLLRNAPDGRVRLTSNQPFDVKGECIASGRHGPTRLILRVGDLVLASYEEANGLGPFVRAGFAARVLRTGQADLRFDSLRVSTTSVAPTSSREGACDELGLVESVQRDYAAELAAGGTSLSGTATNFERLRQFVLEFSYLASKLSARSKTFQAGQQADLAAGAARLATELQKDSDGINALRQSNPQGVDSALDSLRRLMTCGAS